MDRVELTVTFTGLKKFDSYIIFFEFCRLVNGLFM